MRKHIFALLLLKSKKSYQTFSDKLLNLRRKIFGIIDAPKKSKEYLRNFITFTIRHVLINNRLYTLNDENLIALSNKTLREEIKYNYYHARCHGNLDNFKRNFLCDELIGRIENNELILNF